MSSHLIIIGYIIVHLARVQFLPIDAETGLVICSHGIFALTCVHYICVTFRPFVFSDDSCSKNRIVCIETAPTELSISWLSEVNWESSLDHMDPK